MNNTKCNCNLCKMSELREKALKSNDINFVKDVLKEFSNLWENADSDLDYYKCILNGSWPTSEKILKESLNNIEKQKEVNND